MSVFLMCLLLLRIILNYTSSQLQLGNQIPVPSHRSNLRTHPAMANTGPIYETTGEPTSEAYSRASIRFRISGSISAMAHSETTNPIITPTIIPAGGPASEEHPPRRLVLVLHDGFRPTLFRVYDYSSSKTILLRPEDVVMEDSDTIAVDTLDWNEFQAVLERKLGVTLDNEGLVLMADINEERQPHKSLGLILGAEDWRAHLQEFHNEGQKTANFLVIRKEYVQNGGAPMSLEDFGFIALVRTFVIAPILLLFVLSGRELIRLRVV